jgi:hypothetical protein
MTVPISLQQHSQHHCLTQPVELLQRQTQTRSLSQQDPNNGNGKLVLPQLNLLHEAFKRSQVSHPASYSSQDQQPTLPSPILLQHIGHCLGILSSR